MTLPIFSLRRLLVLSAAALLAACGGDTPPPGAQAPEVGVVAVRPAEVPMVSELPGRVSPLRIAEVRARVDGIVLRRAFVEGSDVRAGQLLYLDPAPYLAARDSAQAALAKAQANLTATRLQAERYRSLVTARAVSKQDYDNAHAAQLQAQADVAAAKAALQTARINLAYCDVTAPIAGRVGKAMVTEGAYVRQGEATLMATVQQLDSIYVDVSQSSAELLRLRREFANGELQRQDQASTEVSLLLEDGSVYGPAGELQFSDITVEEGTGTFTVRALFPNPEGVLLPGMFVRARVAAGVESEALLVPQQGVTYNLKGEPTALAVGDGDTVELRRLTVKRAVGNHWLVTAGLKPGDRVVVEGLQRIRPGVQVKPTAAGAASQASAAATAAAPRS